MGQSANPTRQNRTSTVDFQEPSISWQLMNDGTACVDCVCACLLSLGCQLAPKATCTGGGCLPRPSHDARLRLGGLTIGRLQCPACQAVLTVWPHVVLRYRRLSPAVARQALIATPGGLSRAWWATLFPSSPRSL